MSSKTVSADDDHRAFNRHGEAFDKGETFAGVPYEIALEAVEEIRGLVRGQETMVQLALRWILMDEAVSAVIPGAKNKAQAEANASASDIEPISAETMTEVQEIYERRIAPHVHQAW